MRGSGIIFQSCIFPGGSDVENKANRENRRLEGLESSDCLRHINILLAE